MHCYPCMPSKLSCTQPALFVCPCGHTHTHTQMREGDLWAEKSVTKYWEEVHGDWGFMKR